MDHVSRPLLPPAYDLVVLADGHDASARAKRAALSGRAVDGTVFWSERRDRLEMALLLEPEAPAAQTALVHTVAAVALADALGSLLPPLRPVAFALPGTVLLDGASVGGLCLRLAPSDAHAIPAWCILEIVVDLLPGAEEPGHTPWRTCLGEAGGAAITAAALLEALCRHLLVWMHRWSEDGFAPVAAAWNARQTQAGIEATQGRLEPDGSLVQGDHRRPLHAALAGGRAV